MSALSRFGPTIARAGLLQHHRHMASASVASDPVQRLFLEKIKEFKTSNKGLDAAHEKAMAEEMARLKRVYMVDDETKLTQLEAKFPADAEVSLRDFDEDKEHRALINSGEYHKQVATQNKRESALMASIPEQVTHDMHLPPLNKPDPLILYDKLELPKPMDIGEAQPDYVASLEKMTPEKLEREFNVRFGPKMPTINDDNAPERDTVNYPRQRQDMDCPPTRLHIIPESWFSIFYPKTGVTGPYAFALSFGTFLLSKEWIVWEHELLTGITTMTIFAYAINKYGPKLSAWYRKDTDQTMNAWENWRTGNIATLEKLQQHYRKEIAKDEFINNLYEAREEDLENQVEHEYRNRLQAVYNDTRRRLNYLVSVADSQRQIAHKNMVNWVITNSVASIGQKQENEVLDSCIVNIRQLAAKNANVI